MQVEINGEQRQDSDRAVLQTPHPDTYESTHVCMPGGRPSPREITGRSLVSVRYLGMRAGTMVHKPQTPNAGGNQRGAAVRQLVYLFRVERYTSL